MSERKAASQAEMARSSVLTIREAAAELRIGINQAYAAAKLGVIPTIKIGKRILVPRAALEKFLAGAA